VGDGINQVDASGEEVIHHLVDRLRANGVNLAFSGLKKQVLDVMRATGLYQAIGEDRVFANEEIALEAIFRRVEDPEFVPEQCPLHRDFPARRTG
jgi:SulP family sulfate permease